MSKQSIAAVPAALPVATQAETGTNGPGAFRTKGNAPITATGYTDRSGPAAQVRALSLRCADPVEDGLVRRGMPAPAIPVVSRGEANPPMPTADRVHEPMNRRVEIATRQTGVRGRRNGRACPGRFPYDPSRRGTRRVRVLERDVD